MRWMALILVLPCFGEDCLEFGRPVKLDGQLVLRDDRGYRQILVLELGSPICTRADPGRHMLVSLRVSEVRVYEADRGTGEILDRLAGQRAAVTGQLAPAASGYDGTTVVISVSAVKPMDAIGERALRAKLPVINTLDTYDAAIRTGSRLAVDVKDPKSGKPLRPVKEYVDYWLTPTGVLWASCRDGYALRSGRISPEESGECDGQQCSLSKPLYETVTLTFRCEKKLQK